MMAMHRFSRSIPSIARLAAAGVLLLPTILAAQSRTTARPRAGDPWPKPTLVVLFTVDQFTPVYLERYGSQLDGGLARLLHGGAVYLNGFQDHAITETAPGHSVTLSGRFPRSTGIVTNVAGVSDPQAPVIGGGAAPASPFRFRGGTLVDWLRIVDSRTRGLSVSRKDRGAILPMGRAKQNVFWYSSKGTFTTSTYYADTLPDWVRAFNARQLPQSMAGRSWELSRPASLYPEPDSVAVESAGKNYVFPHVLSSSPDEAAAQLPGFPWMDELILSAALAGVRALDLGRGPVPDVLAVSLSTTDAIGHQYGPDSREAHDQILRLDRSLGAFLDSLFALRDSTRVVIALTADHGITPFPEIAGPGRPRDSRHVQLDSIATSMRAQLAVARGDTAALRFDEGVLTLDRDRLAASGIDADSLAAAFAARARRVPGVLRADLVRSLARADTTRDVVARRWIHALPPDNGATVVVTLRPYTVWSGSVAMHGSPSDLDARVPLMFYGAPFRPGVRPERARVVDLAPTLARVLGVTPTDRVDGRVLTAILR
ncbi:MAG TPA: alkaline phosphatase family protein [Gemmatimonadaceae bacterium]|nr:alkaline phosphatase family protein [Gemmatimonadaceae bacterium]